ncbi:MAG: tyrosine-type recombinase/integrase [Gammaproteobacteria bacterium]|nr:tyrosine-type recombinase/integrase [Gammaproteobacteria bacterium]
MGRKVSPGLVKRGKTWHIEKRILGYRLRESSGTESLSEAESYLARRIEEIRQAKVYGVRPKRSFKEAATKYLLEKQHKASIADDADNLKLVCRYIGDLTLEQVHNGTLLPFIKARQAMGRKTKTINNALGVVRHLLNLASSEWIDENGLTWLHVAPKIKLLPVYDARGAYPLSWDEQILLFNQLPDHLKQMAIFKVNVGCREQEVCQLRWKWEIQVPELNTSVFIVPSHIVKQGKLQQLVKNGNDRLIVLNNAAQAVIEQVRGINQEYVFTYQGRPVSKMNSSAWRRARKAVSLPRVRVHDLKHTFGRRLRAAGVSREDRQDLLGHKSRHITTHYSAAELHNLIGAANKACDRSRQGSAFTLLRTNEEVSCVNARKMPTAENFAKKPQAL